MEKDDDDDDNIKNILRLKLKHKSYVLRCFTQFIQGRSQRRVMG
jgi:hypothetical protein